MFGRPQVASFPVVLTALQSGLHLPIHRHARQGSERLSDLIKTTQLTAVEQDFNPGLSGPNLCSSHRPHLIWLNDWHQLPALATHFTLGQLMIQLCIYTVLFTVSLIPNNLNPQVLCTCWSFLSHTALCSVWIGGTETHEDSSQGASLEFFRNSPRQGCPMRYFGTMSPSIRNRRSCTTCVPPGRYHSIFKGPAHTWKIQPTFSRSKTKQTKIQPPLWQCSKCPWGVKWGHVWSALPPTSVYHPVERGCLHGDVPPPLPPWLAQGECSPEWQEKLLSRPAGWWNPLQWPRRSARKWVTPWNAKSTENRYVTSSPPGTWLIHPGVWSGGSFRYSASWKKRLPFRECLLAKNNSHHIFSLPGSWTLLNPLPYNLSNSHKSSAEGGGRCCQSHYFPERKPRRGTPVPLVWSPQVERERGWIQASYCLVHWVSYKELAVRSHRNRGRARSSCKNQHLVSSGHYGYGQMQKDGNGGDDTAGGFQIPVSLLCMQKPNHICKNSRRLEMGNRD